MLSVFLLPSPRGADGQRPLAARLLWCAVLLGLVLYGVLGQKLGMLSVLTTVFLYVVLTQAWNILGGYGGYLNFGTVAYFGVGAYTSAVLFHYFGLSPFLTALPAGLMAAFCGFLVGVPTLRLRGAYFAIVTMIITFAVQILVLNLTVTQGALGIFLAPLPLTPLEVERLFYFLFLGFAVLVTLLVYAVEHSNFGWALVAIREDEDAAEIIGVRSTAIKWTANALAAFIIGIAGGLYAQRIQYLEPTGTFAFDVSLNVVLMAVIGGAGSWIGPLIGAPLVVLVADVLRVTFTSEVNRVVFSIVVILIALYLPGGIVKVVSTLRDRFVRRHRPPPAAAPGEATP